MRSPAQLPVSPPQSGSRIRVLPPELIARIAAGEVVERPASILKELLENALDAHARTIRVTLEDGGLALVRVHDDGCGMNPRELALSIRPHATSKLPDAAALDNLGACSATLGFRGEALPSIAAVTRLKIVSRQRPADTASANPAGSDADGASGWAIACAGGEPAEPEAQPAASAYGTRVEARELFFNLPARRKFLKGVSSEAAACADAFLRLALTRPAVSFSLQQGRCEILSLPAVGPADSSQLPAGSSLCESSAYFARARAALGGTLAECLVEIDCVQPARPPGASASADSSSALGAVSPSAGSYRVRGLLTPPTHSRSNRAQLYLSVNGRAVKDRTLTSALLEACRHLLPPRRYPAGVLHVEVPPEDVDINVHPAKAEVRFRNPSRVYSLLHHAVRQAAGLSGAPVQPPPAGTGAEESPATSFAAQSDLLAFPATGPLFAAAPALADCASEAPAPFGLETWGAGPGLELSEQPAEIRSRNPGAFGGGAPSAGVRVTDSRARLDFRVIGQAAGSYILVEDRGGLHAIDQHALHERILFERLLQRARLHARGDSQRLLVPQAVELSTPQAALLNADSGAPGPLAELAALGFDCVPFGARTLLVQGVPAILTAAAAARILADLLENLADPDRAPSGPAGRRWSLREKAAYILSCKAAIKAGERLTQAQMTALLDEFSQLCGDSSTGPTGLAGSAGLLRGILTCPHGRPLALEVTWAQLQRAVGR